MVTVQLTSTPRQFVALPGRAARWTELAIAAESVQQKLGKDFGISEALHNWLTKADTEDGVSPGVWDELRVARTGCICVDRGAFGPGRAFLRVRHATQKPGANRYPCDESAPAVITPPSFFALLHSNVLDRQHWTTRKEHRLASSPGLRKPTTAGAVNAASAALRPLSLRQSKPAFKPPENH